jgi:hypothetical protein
MLRRSRPAAPWGKYGLLAHAFRASEMGEPRYASLPRANRFRLALQEAGGLYLWFGHYLAGRTDLLASTYAAQLRTLRTERAAETPPSSVPELSGRVSDWELLRITPASEVYAARAAESPIVLEIFHPEEPPFTEQTWTAFRHQMRLLRDSEEAPAAQFSVLDRFREWLLLHADIERKRVILRNLQDVPVRCVSRFPQPLQDFQSPRCLAYIRTEGTPLVDSGGSISSEANVHLWAESLLEQSLLLSLVDAEAQPENYLVLPDGSLGFKAVPALVSVPVEWHYELLQYVTSAAAGNTPRALQMLSRMSGSHSPYGTEQALFEKLSALQPELKINVVSPESIAALENYWRAISHSSRRLPAFLELFHRNLMVLGQSSESPTPTSDAVSDALWPTLGRVLQFRIGDILASDKGQDWMASSGLLAMSAVRQVAVTLEQVRDNDLALVLERQTTESSDGHSNRRMATLVACVISLVLFLFLLQLSSSFSGRVPALAAAAAVLVSAAVLSFLVSRIE